jgi:hypothetical protein
MIIHKGYAKFNFSSVLIKYPNSREMFALMKAFFVLVWLSLTMTGEC